jgi:cytochrome c-type biogenesis protein CcmH/NrfG
VTVTRAAKKHYARLGLTPGASRGEVEQAHRELVSFLEGAPDELRRWARNEIGAVNEAHAALTAPGSGRSARGDGRLKRVVVGLATLAIAVGVVIGVYKAGDDGGGSQQAGAAQSQGLGPGDRARVGQLMRKLERNSKDVGTLVALGDVYFQAEDYANASTWMEQAVALQPDNVKARLALGASQYNLDEAADAKAQWEKVIELDPKNVEAYYDLGFLYLSKQPPDVAKAKQLWRKVIELAPPGSSVAKTVATHLEGLEKAEESGTATTAGNKG